MVIIKVVDSTIEDNLLRKNKDYKDFHCYGNTLTYTQKKKLCYKCRLRYICFSGREENITIELRELKKNDEPSSIRYVTLEMIKEYLLEGIK